MPEEELRESQFHVSKARQGQGGKLPAEALAEDLRFPRKARLDRLRLTILTASSATCGTSSEYSGSVSG